MRDPLIRHHAFFAFRRLIMSRIVFCSITMLFFIASCTDSNKSTSTVSTNAQVKELSKASKVEETLPTNKIKLPKNYDSTNWPVQVKEIKVQASTKQRPIGKGEVITLEVYTSTPYKFPGGSRVGVYFDLILKYAVFKNGDGSLEDPATFSYKIEEAVKTYNGIKLDSKIDFRKEIPEEEFNSEIKNTEWKDLTVDADFKQKTKPSDK